MSGSDGFPAGRGTRTGDGQMTVSGRRSSTHIRLLRHGFTDPSTAERLLDAPEMTTVRSDSLLLDALGATADPDLALRGLVRLVESQDPDERMILLDTLVTAKPLRDRLLGVLGASEALGDHLARHPEDWHALVTYELSDLHPGVEEFEDGLADADDPGLAAHRLPPLPAGHRGQRRLRYGRSRPDRRGAGRPGDRDAACRPRDRQGRRAGGRRRVPARGDRDGQVRRPRAELRLGRGRDLRRRSGGRTGRRGSRRQRL